MISTYVANGYCHFQLPNVWFNISHWRQQFYATEAEVVFVTTCHPLNENAKVICALECTCYFKRSTIICSTSWALFITKRPVVPWIRKRDEGKCPNWFSERHLEIINLIGTYRVFCWIHNLKFSRCGCHIFECFGHVLGKRESADRLSHIHK